MLLLTAWLAIAIYFSAVVAPSVFEVLRSFSLPNASEVAGAIVTRTLSAVNKSGFFLSLLLLITAFGVKKCYGRASFIFQNALLLIIALATGVGEWVIATKMRGLRAAMHGQIDQLPLTDPNRMAFASLHVYSVGALLIAMIGAVLVILLMILTAGRGLPIQTK
jgi:hypothetical protein